MPDFVVSTAFKSQDRVTKSFGNMGRGADKFGKRATSAFRKASKEGTRFKSIVGGILTAGAVGRGIGLLKQGVGGVVTQFIEFDDAVTGAAVRFKDIGPDAANFSKQLGLIKARAREAGATTEFTAAQAAKALDFLARTGFKSAEAMGSLGSMINLATATGEDFASVADMSSDLLGAFGLAANTTAQKISNLNRLNDVLVKTVNSANVTVESMFETMKKVGPVATGVLGASLEEVAALTGVLGSSGIKGSDAMTALKNAYLKLAAPTGKGAEVLKELNITLDDGTGNAKKMTDLMAEMGEKLKDMGTIKQAEILDAVFGKRAIAGGKNIIDNIANIKEFEKSLLNAGGTSQKTADIIRQSLGNRLKTLGSSATEAGFKFLSAFDKNGKDAISRLTDAVRKFDMQPVIDGAKTAISLFKTLLSVIKPFIPIIPVLVAGMVAYSAALKIQTFIAFIQVLRSVAVAQGILNAVMIANPIGLVIAGITLLIAAGILLVKNWDKVKIAFKVVADYIKKVFVNPLLEWNKLIMGSIIGIIRAASKVAGAVGFDTKGLDSAIAKMEKIRLKTIMDLSKPEQQDEKTNKPKYGPRVEAPNKSEVESKQNISIDGKMQIAGAPEGSTGQIKTNYGNNFNMEFLGVNP